MFCLKKYILIILSLLRINWHIEKNWNTLWYPFSRPFIMEIYNFAVPMHTQIYVCRLWEWNIPSQFRMFSLTHPWLVNLEFRARLGGDRRRVLHAHLNIWQEYKYMIWYNNSDRRWKEKVSLRWILGIPNETSYDLKRQYFPRYDIGRRFSGSALPISAECAITQLGKC